MTILKLAEDGVWTWFHDPRGVEGDGRTFYGWFSHEGVFVGQYDHATGETAQTKVIDVWEVSTFNDHVIPAVGIRTDGRILVAYADHANSPMYVRISTNPNDITAMGPQFVAGSTLVTYPMLTHLSGEGTQGKGRWYLVYRGPGAGPRSYMTSDDDGETWSAEVSLMTPPGHRPYMKMWSNGVDTIHFTNTDGHPREFPTNSVYHFKRVAGAWQRSDGSSMGSPPFVPTDATKIYDGTTNRGWLWDVCGDPTTGHPIVTYQARHSALDIRYHYARWTGSAWVSHEVVSGGRTLYDAVGFEDDYGGGMMLNHDDPTIAYVSREVSGTHELEKWSTADGGATWTSEAITSDSGVGVKNFRPWYIAGDGPIEVIWNRGPYTTYNAFDTDVYGLVRSTARRRGAVAAFL